MSRCEPALISSISVVPRMRRYVQYSVYSTHRWLHSSWLHSSIYNHITYYFKVRLRFPLPPASKDPFGVARRRTQSWSSKLYRITCSAVCIYLYRIVLDSKFQSCPPPRAAKKVNLLPSRWTWQSPLSGAIKKDSWIHHLNVRTFCYYLQ